LVEQKKAIDAGRNLGGRATKYTDIRREYNDGKKDCLGWSSDWSFDDMIEHLHKRLSLETDGYIVRSIYRLSPNEAREYKQQQKASSVEKIRSYNHLHDPDGYIKTVRALLNSRNPQEAIVGLAGVTGRRLIECVVMGSFDPVPGEEYKAVFSGQAKRRDSIAPTTYTIPILADIESVRQAKEFIMISYPEYRLDKWKDQIELNERVNISMSTQLNRVAKKWLGQYLDGLSFKSTRDIYAAICYAHVPASERGSKAVYYAGILGHALVDAGLAYDKIADIIMEDC
jgi:hypothetical protein